MATKMKKVGIFFLILILLVAFELYRSNMTVGISEYTVGIEALPDEFDGFRIAQISDLHNKCNLPVERALAKCNPDIVVMTGDMVSSWDRDFYEFLQLASNISDKYPTYFIVGNHEQMLPHDVCASLVANLADHGVVVLDNSSIAIERADAKISLHGLWFHLRYYRDKNDEKTADYIVQKKTLDTILGKAPSGVNIMLAHNPVYFDAYEQWGADLVLAGHMHGGVVRIPGYGGLLSPEKEFFPKYDAGRFEKDAATMLVSRGIGNSIGIRVFNQPEIIVTDLTKK